MFIGIVDESKASVIFNSYRWFCDLLGCLCVVFLTFGSLSVLRSSITLNKLSNDKLFHSNSLCVFFFSWNLGFIFSCTNMFFQVSLLDSLLQGQQFLEWITFVLHKI